MKRLAMGLLGLIVGGLSVSQTIPASAAEEKIIKIGAPLSMSGRHQINGKHTRRGYNLASTVINGNGGIEIGDTTYRIKLVYYDDESNPKLAEKFAKRLINKDKVQFLLGPYGSENTEAVAMVAERAGIPLVQGNGASNTLFEQKRRFMFGVLSTSDSYLSEALNLVAEQAKKMDRKPSSITIGIAVENDLFSKDLRQGVINEAKKFGMDVVVDEILPRDYGDMTFILDQVESKRPDLLIVSGHEGGADLAIRQIMERKLTVPMVAMTHCEGADVHGKYGLGANYTICATQWSSEMPYEGKWFGTAHDYKRKFEAEYGYSPPYQAAESTAALLVLADAIQRAASLDPEEVRAALAATDVQTFFGWVRFDEYGRNKAKPMVLRQLVQGRYLIVAPSGFARHEVIFPRPAWPD